LFFLNTLNDKKYGNEKNFFAFADKRRMLIMKVLMTLAMMPVTVLEADTNQIAKQK
jgi:hypothetical protein